MDYSPARPLNLTTEPQRKLLTLGSQAQDQEHRLTVEPADRNLCHNCAHATRGAKKIHFLKTTEQASKQAHYTRGPTHCLFGAAAGLLFAAAALGGGIAAAAEELDARAGPVGTDVAAVAGGLSSNATPRLRKTCPFSRLI